MLVHFWKNYLSLKFQCLQNFEKYLYSKITVLEKEEKNPEETPSEVLQTVENKEQEKETKEEQETTPLPLS